MGSWFWLAVILLDLVLLWIVMSKTWFALHCRCYITIWSFAVIKRVMLAWARITGSDLDEDDFEV